MFLKGFRNSVGVRDIDVSADDGPPGVLAVVGIKADWGVLDQLRGGFAIACVANSGQPNQGRALPTLLLQTGQPGLFPQSGIEIPIANPEGNGSSWRTRSAAEEQWELGSAQRLIDTPNEFVFAFKDSEIDGVSDVVALRERHRPPAQGAVTVPMTSLRGLKVAQELTGLIDANREAEVEQ